MPRIALVCVLCVFPALHLYALDDSYIQYPDSRIKSYLDEKESAAIYMESKLGGEEDAKPDLFNDPLVSLKDEVFKDDGLTENSKLAVSKRLIKGLIEAGKDDEALDVCKKFAAEYPGNKMDILRLYYSTAEILQKLGRYDDAIEAYKFAASYPEKSGITKFVHINLGWCYYLKKNYDDAVKEYSLVLQTGSPGISDRQWLWFETGRCRFFMNDFDAAVGAFEQVIKTDPSSRLSEEAKKNIKDIEKLKNGGA